jgi:hypothetical protein
MRRSLGTQKFLFTILLLLWLPSLALAGIEWQSLREVNLDGKALDVTVSADGKLVFALTPGKILVYAAIEDKVIDQIPVDGRYTRITYSDEERLILSAADPATLQILKYERVYDINITNRPFRGPQDARVTLVVFDDYQ